MQKIIIAICVLVGTLVGMIASTSVAGANPKFVDTVGVDRFAHFGCSYVINDQLHRSCHFNRFWAATATLAIGAAKEAWIDDHFDRGDFAANAAGVLLYQVRF